ncbi:MAG TPA: hypothetical protein VJ692_14990, partial [Nitrospiraceae bacterium]|nr:hypothetical protein [Nitrospiraceae bacterium]
TIYPALTMMEESGRIRRGLFVAGLGATQFATPAALDLLRSLKDEPDSPEVIHLAATDPANPYGALLKWPPIDAPDGPASSSTHGQPSDGAVPTLARAVGASVILINGALGAYLRRRNPDIVVCLPLDEPARTLVARAVSTKLVELAQSGKQSLLISQINGVVATRHPLARFLDQAGFVHTPMGFHVRRPPTARPAPATAGDA